MATVDVGDILAGKLQVEGVLGRGGMGLVLVARHTILNERVAVKLMRSEDPLQRTDPTQLERFYREARAAARLKGAHITRVMDVGVLDDGSPYIVMEHIDGVTLSQTLRQRGPLPIEEAADLMMQACEGLAEAHAAGIVHRDIKPSNLMITRGVDGSPLVKILDFGIARHGGENSTLTGSSVMLGSPSYMSPEQIRDAHEVDARSDLWSLGVTLYELLTGHLPYEAFTPAGLIARISVDPPAPPENYRPELPPGLQQLLLRCLEKSPADRFASVVELADALLPFVSPRSNQIVPRIHRVFEERRADAISRPLPLLVAAAAAPAHPTAPTRVDPPAAAPAPAATYVPAATEAPATTHASASTRAPDSFAATQQAGTFSQEPLTRSTNNPVSSEPEPAPRPHRAPWIAAGVVALGAAAALLWTATDPTSRSAVPSSVAVLAPRPDLSGAPSASPPTGASAGGFGPAPGGSAGAAAPGGSEGAAAPGSSAGGATHAASASGPHPPGSSAGSWGPHGNHPLPGVTPAPVAKAPATSPTTAPPPPATTPPPPATTPPTPATTPTTPSFATDFGARK